MSQSTPGRRRNDSKHAKYNPDPKNVGTYSGKPMPTGVPRVSNGMEDPDQFFQSSPIAPDTGKTGRTARPDTEPPSSGRSRKGRMSQLENEGSGDDTFAQDLLRDDDFPNDGSPAPASKKTQSTNLASGSQARPRTPSGGNNPNPSPSSGSPRTYARNRANNSTIRKQSTIGVGYRPSPVGQTSTIGVGVGGSPASRKTTSAVAPARPAVEDVNGEMDMELDLDDLDMELDDTGAADTTVPTAEDEEEEEETPAKSKGKAGKGKAKGRVEEENATPVSGRKGRRDPDEDEEEDVGGDDEPEVGPEEDEEEPAMTRSELIQKGKMAAKKQREKVAAAEAEEEEPEVENQGSPELENQEDENGPEEEDVDDNGGGYDGREAEEEDDAALEQAAIDAEENGGSGQEEEMEDDDAEPAPVAKRGRPKAAPRGRVATTAGTGGRKKRDANGQVIKTTKRLSRLNEDGEEGDGVHGDFQTRRTGRQHIAPLRGWMNEKFEYTKGPHGTIVKSVVRMPEEPVVPFAAGRAGKKSKRGRSQSARPLQVAQGGGEGLRHPEAGWDDMTVPLGKVIDYETGIETERRVVYPARLLNPKVIEGEGSFRYQKVFGDDVYMASGLLELPANHGFKPEKSSKDNSYTFYVVQGAINMKIHKTSYILAPGGMSMVPRGNKYSIENVSQNDAVLFFSQARKIRMREDEEAVHEASQLSQSQRSAVGPAKRKRGSLKVVQEEEPEEEEEEGSQEEEEEEVVRRPVAKGKKRGKAR